MQISRFRLPHRKAMIVSMKELINRYEIAMIRGTSKSEYENTRNIKCLLCHPIDLKTGRQEHNTIRCKDCPWILIEGTKCTEIPRYVNDRYVGRVYNCSVPEIQQERVDQLYDWIDYYEKNTVFYRIKDNVKGFFKLMFP